MNFSMNHSIDNTIVKLILKSVQEGDLSTIQSNINKYRVNMNYIIDTDNQQNAFFYCSLIKDDNNALNICKFLLKIGVNPLFKDKHQQTCLYYTAREGKYLTSKYLIEICGLPINERDIYGQNPIYYSVREGKIDICQLFVEKGVDINLEDKFGQTCIFYAIKTGHYEIVNFLIKNGANINKVDKKKQTPVSYAVKMNQDKIVELLVENGAIKPETKKNEKEKKNNNLHLALKKEKSNNIDSEKKKNIIENIQVPKKYILVKIDENGEKIPLTQEELNDFMKKNPEINDIVNNKNLLKNLVNEIKDDEIKMCESWEKIAKQLMNTLWKFKDAELFHKPVDPIELNIPNYFDIIKKPMDFSTVKKKLNNYSYTNLKEYCDDMDLIFNNCILYNGINSYVGEMCLRVKNEYKNLFVKYNLDKYL